MPASTFAGDLAISARCVQNWMRPDRIDRGEIEGVPRAESADLRRARARIGELEREVEILRLASNLLGQQVPHPKGSTR